MQNSDLTDEFYKSMQNLEILFFEGNIDEGEFIELIGKYAVRFYINLLYILN